MSTQSTVSQAGLLSAEAAIICDFMGWPEDGPAWEDALKLAQSVCAATHKRAYKEGWNDREGDFLVGAERVSPNPARQDNDTSSSRVREEVARIIDPEAFSIGRAGPDYANWRNSAYTKADAILSLLSSSREGEGIDLADSTDIAACAFGGTAGAAQCQSEGGR